MPTLKTIFETCRPRRDVLAGSTRDERFGAEPCLILLDEISVHLRKVAVALQEE